MIKNLKSAYTLYRKDKGTILRDEYYIITQDFMKFISDKVIEGYEVCLPQKCGSVEILLLKGKMAYPKKPINWSLTRQIWRENPEKRKKEFIYGLGEFMNGFCPKVKWSRIGIYAEFKYIYYFVFTRHNKKKLLNRLRTTTDYKTI